MAATTSIFSRKLDLIYVLWFAMHLVIMFTVDLVPLYPAALRPQSLLNLRHWYIATYNDRFFTQPPAWFVAYAWMELLYHVPLSVWAIGALVRDDPRVPVQLLVWAVQTAITTFTCIADFMSWEGLTTDERAGLMGLYLPYCILAVLVGADMVARLQTTVLQRNKTKKL